MASTPAPPPARRSGSDAARADLQRRRAGVRPGRAVRAFLRFPSLRAAPFRSPPPCPGAAVAARPVWRLPPGEGRRGPLSCPRAGRSALAAIVRAGDAPGWWQRPAGLSWAGSGLAERAWALWGWKWVCSGAGPEHQHRGSQLFMGHTVFFPKTAQPYVSWGITRQKEACNPDCVLHKTLTRTQSSFLQSVTGVCVIPA